MEAWLLLRPDPKGPSNEQIYELEAPEVDERAEYLLGLFFGELGVGVPGANGLSSMPWAEIESWASLVGYRLSLFEVKALKAMSLAFSTVINEPKTACPLDDEEVAEQINAANAAMWKAFAKS